MFSGYALWFTIPALIATGAFVIKLSLLLAGADHSGIDLHSDGDVPGHDTGAFKLLSVQAMTGFLMGFGWGGFASLKGSGFGLLPSIGIGVVCGLGMMWILAVVLRGMHELESSGNINVEDVVGREAVVDVTVPAGRGGSGRIKVVVDERQRSYAAVTEGGELARATRVRILSAEGDNTLTVAAA
jgi:hypothetical protein